MRTILATLLLLAACDPEAALCDLATEQHRERCENGDTASCAWLDEHATAAGTCR